ELLPWSRKTNHQFIRQRWPERAREIVGKLEANEVVQFSQEPGSPPMLAVNFSDVQIVLDLDAAYVRVAPDGWVGLSGDTFGRFQMMLDARVTDELKSEGLARDVIRQVQDYRKDSRLNIEDRIALYLSTDSPRLQAAIDAHRDHIAAETLTVQWTDSPPGEVREVKIEGQELKIAIRKVA